MIQKKLMGTKQDFNILKAHKVIYFTFSEILHKLNKLILNFLICFCLFRPYSGGVGVAIT